MKRPPSALLISPPVYDVQYWANWSMPYGLLRVASWLQGKGYMLKLIDCMEANKRRTVPKQMRCVRKLGSADEPFTPDKWTDYEPQPDEKIEYVFGMPLKELRKRLEAIKARARYVRESLFDEVAFPEPDEIWISSIMTYWWESTRDVIEVCRQVFPKAVFRVGGIYPTLIPEHAMQNLGLNNPLHLMGRELDPLNAKQKKRDIVVSATIPDANPLPLAIELYDKDGAGDDEDGAEGERLPDYLIMTTSRGCPFKCAYCSANVLNEGRKIWVREYEVAYDEIKRRFEQGIREFCFYEDNLLLGRDNFTQLCRLIRDDRDLKGIELHAPEGIEVRLLHEDTVQLMRDAGFKRLYLPLETVNANMAKIVATDAHKHGQVFLRVEQRGEGRLQVALPRHQLLHSLRLARRRPASGVRYNHICLKPCRLRDSHAVHSSAEHAIVRAVPTVYRRQRFRFTPLEWEAAPFPRLQSPQVQVAIGTRLQLNRRVDVAT